MRDATHQAVLVISASFEPMSICSARRAIALVVKDKAVVQEDTGITVYAGIMFPSVVRLKERAFIPYRTQVISRRNILLRDRHTCQYCGTKIRPDKLTLDHVIPKSQGGLNTWGNLVACCERCNRFKANRTPEEAGMVLRMRPRPATIHTSRQILRSMGAEDPRWRRYLYFDSNSDDAYVAR